MSAEVYDEIEIEDLDFDAETGVFYYPCPCGDKFQITLEEIKLGNDIAKCPSCSLTIRIVYDANSYKEYEEIQKEMCAAWAFLFYLLFFSLLFIFVQKLFHILYELPTILNYPKK